MGDVGLTFTEGSVAASDGAVVDSDARRRFRALVDAHYDFIWRSLRRLGVASGDADDGAQQVFLTALRKLGAIRVGSERSFLFQTAVRVAADGRRARRRRPEVASNEDSQDPAPGTEDLLDLWRARRMLDEILDGMPMDLRAVFVLAELDELTMAEVAALLEVPVGTVASRLRRARAEFRKKAARIPLHRTPAGDRT